MREQLFDQFVHFFKGALFPLEAIFRKAYEGCVVVSRREPAAHEVVDVGICDPAINAEFARDLQGEGADLRFAGKIIFDLVFSEFFVRVQFAEHLVQFAEAALFEKRSGEHDDLGFESHLVRPFFEKFIIVRLGFTRRPERAEDFGDVAAAKHVVGEFFFHLFDRRDAFRGKIFGDL